MSERTKISWASSTASPWYGCTKVSPGCAHCYAEGWAERSGRDVWGKGKPRQKSKSFERDCRRWEKERIALLCSLHENSDGTWGPHNKIPDRPRIFPSLCDVFDDEVPIEDFAWFLGVMHECKNLDFLLLTKRPENFWGSEGVLANPIKDHPLDFPVYDNYFEGRIEAAQNFLSDGPLKQWLCLWANGHPPDNIWMGTSVEDQKRADERIPELLKIPAKVRFLSVEPLLSPVDLQASRSKCCVNKGCFPQDGRRLVADSTEGGILVECDCSRLHHIDWIIVGGESGPNRRDCGAEAICDVAKQCVAAGVPVWVKQASARMSEQQGDIPDDIFALKQLPKV